MPLEGTDYTTADVINAAAELIQQHGLVHANDAESLHDFGEEKGYDITRAFDVAVYGDPGWSSDFLYILGVKQPSLQYDTGRRAVRAVIEEHYPIATLNEEAWNEWDSTMTVESYVDLLHDALSHIPEDVTAA